MRLSAELIGSAEQRSNPLGEREIILRGLAIPSIEHLAVTRDAFDVMDFTDNRLVRLDNFPRLLRLSTLLVANNVLETLDNLNLAKNVPNLKYLDLSHNHMSSLLEISNLGKACTKLEALSLQGNPVQRRQHYRLYTIQNIPSLKVLDHQRVTKTERDRAQRLASSAAGAALETDVQKEGRGSAAAAAGSTTKTFTPGEGNSAEESFVVNFSPQEKERIRQMVANAKSPQEIEEIERSVKRGILPKLVSEDEISSSRNDLAASGSSSRKRPPAETTDGGEEDDDDNDGQKDPNSAKKAKR